MNRSQRFRARLVAGLLVFALVSVFTPCCELFAGVTAGAPDAAADRAHGHGTDGMGMSHGDGPAPDSACPVSFDAVVTVPSDLMVGASVLATANFSPAAFAVRFDPPVALHRAALRPRASGPPLYLRFAHLLI